MLKNKKLRSIIYKKEELMFKAFCLSLIGLSSLLSVHPMNKAGGDGSTKFVSILVRESVFKGV